MLCRWLEEELARRYRDAAPATLALLQERCEGAAAELVAAESRLQAAEDVTSLRRAGDRCFSIRDMQGAAYICTTYALCSEVKCDVTPCSVLNTDDNHMS